MTEAIFRMESLGYLKFWDKCREFIINKQIILNKITNFEL